MFAVGVDVSNARSTVAVLQSKTKVAIKPFEVQHNTEGFAALAGTLNALDGEARIVWIKRNPDASRSSYAEQPHGNRSGRRRVQQEHFRVAAYRYGRRQHR